MSTVKKIRLDELLLTQGLAASRSQAKALILAGKVRLGTQRLDKPGRILAADAAVTVEAPPRFVSRGGDKLESFLEHFNIDVTGLHHLDVGASTGGFTDCCLQRGSLRATCVDVGRAQLHHQLLRDKRVINLEKTNARHLQPGDLPDEDYPLIVMDLSFISLTKVLPAVWQFLAPQGRLIALVKPQFEAERQEVNAARGIIRDEVIQQRVLQQIQSFALAQLPNAQLIGTLESPIKGADGNREFLIGLTRQTESSGHSPCRRVLPAAPTLVIDASSATLFAGVLDHAGQWLAQSEHNGTALESLFPAVAVALEAAQVTLQEVRNFVYCEGPGSVLGLRLCAMAMQTWNHLSSQPIQYYAYNSLQLSAALIAIDSPEVDAALLVADWKKGAWNAIRLTQGQAGPSEVVDDATLASWNGALFHLPQRKGWQAPPETATTLQYRPQRLPEVLHILKHTEQVELYSSGLNVFQTWTRQRHRRTETFNP